MKRKGDVDLRNISTRRAQQTIRDLALNLEDYDLQTKVLEQDLIALEAKYHDNCLSTYIQKAERMKKQSDSDPKPVDPYTEAFKELLQVIEEEFREGKAFEMTALRLQYETFLQKYGIASYRGEKLKRRLMKYFKGKVTFHKPGSAKKSELVYSSDIDIRTTINKIADMKKAIREEGIEQDLFSDENDSYDLSLVNTAILIRSAIKSVDGIAANRCIDKNDITEERAKAIIPEILFRFAAALLGGSQAHDIVKDSNNIDKHLERKIISLCQDIIYTVKKSRVKTPKHVGLSMSIKHLTGSKQVVNMLHSQGHCLSYDDLCRIESAIATETLELAEQSGGVYIPTNLVPVGPFVQLWTTSISMRKHVVEKEQLMFWEVCFIKRDQQRYVSSHFNYQ